MFGDADVSFCNAKEQARLNVARFPTPLQRTLTSLNEAESVSDKSLSSETSSISQCQEKKQLMVLFDDEDPFNYNSYLSENTLAAVLISVFPFAAFDSAVVGRDIKGGYMYLPICRPPSPPRNQYCHSTAIQGAEAHTQCHWFVYIGGWQGGWMGGGYDQ